MRREHVSLGFSPDDFGFQDRMQRVFDDPKFDRQRVLAFLEGGPPHDRDDILRWIVLNMMIVMSSLIDLGERLNVASDDPD